ncbi:NAD(P)H-binding protein [Streptomyces sp. NPDC059837]|uniref:NAD(P)H-binding protein n=1 Tax=unclassified Streptomyces TaxID=2593676 RepID=UPI00225A7A76|nr:MULTISPECIES: NAD(P)H-binding protein [unclassified Streptomyces]MCX4409436.1 NAD(P)H-binding protein [Streptomyces sp. NBC_01764]MCX5191200.1 NAD(P)H-binding protein [Streptomyces sp. NBC_00268]
MSTKDDRLFLITGATGTTGKETAHLLLARGHRVRALVHREDDRSRALAAAGAEIVVGDLLDFHDVSAAVRGVSGAYFCYPIGPGLVDATVIFAQAASEAGVRSVVNMSQISARREAVSNAARQHWLCERLLDRTSLLTTHLRPTFFAEWLIWWWGLEDDKGVLRLPLGEGRHAPVAGIDQAYVIAAVLENPEPHDRQAYPLYGPVEMDHHGIAEAISKALGIPVTYEPTSVDEFAAGLASLGKSDHLIQHLSNVAIDYRNGIFQGTNNLIEVIGNRTPLSVEAFVDEQRETFAQSGSHFVPAVKSN